MKNSNNPAVQQFIIETVLINPLKDIVKKLEEGSFRDCDIKWLDSKLENFISFALQTLSINLDPVAKGESYKHMNDYVKDKYIGYFSTLTKYFESL